MRINNRFAKLFDFNNHQVLVTKEAEEGQYYTIKEQVDHNYTNYSRTNYFNSEKSRDMTFANYEQKEAALYLNEVMKEAKFK